LPPVQGADPRNPRRLVERLPRDDEPLAALAFKVAMDEGRKIVYVRVFSGTMKAGMSVFNTRLEGTEKIARLFSVHADRRQRLDSAGAGSIVVASGLKRSTTGDTLCAEDDPVAL
jgi:elongation factor G